MTEPEQWAEGLWDHLLNKTFSRRQAIEHLQRAFEEQTRERNKEVEQHLQLAIKRLTIQRSEVSNAGQLEVNCFKGLMHVERARRALATRQSTPTEEPHMISEQMKAEGWIEWTGGDCPVDPYSVPGVIIRGFDRWHLCQMPGGPECDEAQAFAWEWETEPPAAQIIAYKPEGTPNDQ